MKLKLGLNIQHCGDCGAVVLVTFAKTDGVTLDETNQVDTRPMHEEWHRQLAEALAGADSVRGGGHRAERRS